MHTFQIAQALLENYKNEKLTQERVDFLQTQAKEQLDEISQNQKIYNSFLEKAKAPQGMHSIIVWILLMSNEDICCDYINEFDKNFREIIPVGDLADSLLYAIYLKKVKNIELEGFEYLLNYKSEGLDEVDQYSFTNVLLYVQKSKEVEIDF